MIIPGDIGTLIDFFGFTASIFYCAAMVALIVMRFTKKNEHRPIKVYASHCSFCDYLFLLIAFDIISGSHNHPNYRYVGFSYTCRRTHRFGPASAVLLRSVFYPRRTYFLRAFRLLQERDAGNE